MKYSPSIHTKAAAQRISRVKKWLVVIGVLGSSVAFGQEKYEWSDWEFDTTYYESGKIMEIGKYRHKMIRASAGVPWKIIIKQYDQCGNLRSKYKAEGTTGYHYQTTSERENKTNKKCDIEWVNRIEEEKKNKVKALY